MQHGVGAECTMDGQCVAEGFTAPDGGPMPLELLTTFKGGYFRLQNCQGAVNCLQGSACIDTDGENVAS